MVVKSVTLDFDHDKYLYKTPHAPFDDPVALQMTGWEPVYSMDSTDLNWWRKEKYQVCVLKQGETDAT